MKSMSKSCDLTNPSMVGSLVLKPLKFQSQKTILIFRPRIMSIVKVA